MDYVAEPAHNRFMPAVREAQAQLLVSGHYATVAYNAGIAISAAFIVVLTHANHGAVLFWLAAVLASVIARVMVIGVLRHDGRLRADPSDSLKWMTVGALGSGLAWSALPFVIDGFEGTGGDAFIYLVMIGISAGAVIRGTGYSPAAFAFALPPQMAILLSLLLIGDAVAIILAANVLAFVSILVRSGLAAQRIFVSNELAKLEATALAGSLSRANQDIVQSHTRLEVVANRDPVTGLANRACFNEQLASMVATAADSGTHASLLMIDLDCFKAINDTLGHGAGDAVLREVGRRLASHAEEPALVARLGGDEFAILVSGDDAADLAARLAGELIEGSRLPIALPETAAAVGISIGLAHFPEHAANAGDLLACADMALTAAKQTGRRRMTVYDPRMRSRADRQRRIEQDLEQAIAESRIEVWFQPQLSLRTGQVSGFEALLRWFHPQLGAISPPEVVLAAQALHLSDRLTGHIADKACAFLKRLPALGHADATVAINVSPVEFALYSVADMLERVTVKHGVTPGLLEVEITEEAILDTSGAGEQLKRLETAGYKLAVDDFGMGHSSLAYLIGLKVDRLKIDRSFVVGVSESRANQELIVALVGLGKALSIEIVVEGVETAGDSELLRKLGCGIGQGYHFARPMAEDDVVAWLRSTSASKARPTLKAVRSGARA